MENNFDQTIKKLMENYEVEYKPQDWDQMEQRIEEEANLSPQIEDVYLDGIVYDSLHNLNTTYNPDHWDLMNEKIADPYALRRRLMKYKVAEVALVLLFIFTLAHFLPFKKIQRQNIAELNTIQKPESSLDELKEINQVTASPLVSDAQSSLNNQQLTQTNPKQNETDNSFPSLQNETRTINKAVEEDTPLRSQEFEKVAIKEDASQLMAEDFNEKTNSTEASNVESKDGEETKVNTALLNSILLKEADKLVVPGIEELNGSPVFSDLKQPIKVRIGMVFGADANYVMTSANEAQNLESFDQFAPGYSGGFSLGFKYNKWEIETGALYSAVNYGSRNIFEINGSFAEGGYVQQGLVGAELDIIRLPLNVKYNFSEKKKWNVYAFSGASLNMAVETFYNFTTQDVGRSDASGNFATPNPRMPDEYKEQFDRPSYDGIFEGGRFSKNSFLTANLGFGIERYFTPRMSIFLQPSYMHQISKGLGPQSDQINSVSILTGAKVTLKKKKKLKK